MSRTAGRPSLEDLEADRWGPPPPGATGLVARCHRLREVPLDDLDVDVVRCLLGQGIGVRHLPPLARELLRRSEPDAWGQDGLAALLAQHPDWP